MARRPGGSPRSFGKGGICLPELTHTVSGEEAGRTVKSVALREMRLSRGLFSSLKFSGGLTLDGRPVKADARLEAGQTLRAEWRDRMAARLAPYAVPFDIPYEDGRYLIVDKPAPLPTLCSARQEGPTLENALYARLDCPENYVFRPVNRLDKGTSGLLAVARDAHAQQLLQRQLHTDAFVREYLAICRGRLPAREGTIDLPIGQGDGVRREIRPDGRKAVTHYRVEQEGSACTLVRLRLETGRTPQIRVHLAALGCPIAGDYVYGEADARLQGRFALHACTLRFEHPLTGKTIRAESSLPPELRALLD
jgi:23S rRNA pseudouridine1911/1915/1917 synthase